MEIYLNSGFDLESSVNAAWEQSQQRKNAWLQSKQQVENQVSALYANNFQADLNACLSQEIQRCLSVILIPASSWMETSAEIEYLGHKLLISRKYFDEGMIWVILDDNNVQTTCSSENFKSHLLWRLSLIKFAQ
ncbi:hypothetical protein [Calothrix sp. 336/3]|uniref:hypothetical protein n=1 Tax=Calothrix sp. 336/3 TaxID=1337936 RepID=UPI0004E2B2A8|nr:hypothetical protein [Calothrix sp. 336/3]AKG21496.1 hypothetical protein IJ00_09565 [Calothrix sp. 336/3]